MIRTTRSLKVGTALIAVAALFILAACLLLPSGADPGDSPFDLERKLMGETERLVTSISSEVSAVPTVLEVGSLNAGRWSAEADRIVGEIRQRFPQAGVAERRFLDDVLRIVDDVAALRVRVGAVMMEQDLAGLRSAVAEMVAAVAARGALLREAMAAAQESESDIVRRRALASRAAGLFALVCLLIGLFLATREVLRAVGAISADVTSLQRTFGGWLSGSHEPWVSTSGFAAGVLEGPIEVLRHHLADGAERQKEAAACREALDLIENGIDDGLDGKPCPIPEDHPGWASVSRIWSRLRQSGERVRAGNAEREETAQRLREEIGHLQRRASDIGDRLHLLGIEVTGAFGSTTWWDALASGLRELQEVRQRVEEERSEQWRSAASGIIMLERLAESIHEVGEGITEIVESHQHQILVLQTPAENVERLIAQVEVLLDEVQVARRGLEDLVRQASIQAHRSLGVADRAAEVQGLIEQVAEVAKKTNLLALNAAIEAAGAGEYGKGFAVVAKEIRNLAIRSAQTAETLGLTIADMRKQSTMSVLTAEEEGKMARKAVDAFDRYAPALMKMQGGLEEFRRLMDESRSVFKDGIRGGGGLGEKVGDAFSAATDLAERLRESTGGGRG